MAYEKLFSLLVSLVETPTVSGFESRHIGEIKKIALEESGGFLTGAEQLKSGSLLLSHMCKKAGAKKIVLDAHIDTVGFAVNEIIDGGFIKVVPVGSIDPLILPSSPVMIYGKESFTGYFSSVPPHLSHGRENTGLKVGDLYIDTGYPSEKLRELSPVGTPVGFYAKPCMLMNDAVVSHSLDDKACVAALLRAMQLLSEEPCDIDVCVHLSVGEEKTQNGAKTLPYSVTDADACIVLDVNFATVQGVENYESLNFGFGPGVSYSSTTSRKLTDHITSTAKKHGLPCQSVVEMRSTGTNATQTVKNGLPSAVLSIPLKNMHTYCECVSLSDIENCARLLEAAVRDFPGLDFGLEDLKIKAKGAE